VTQTGKIFSLAQIFGIIDFNDLTANHLGQSGANVVIDGGSAITVTLLDFQTAQTRWRPFVRLELGEESGASLTPLVDIELLRSDLATVAGVYCGRYPKRSSAIVLSTSETKSWSSVALSDCMSMK